MKPFNPFSLTGKVIHGNHFGRQLGYPTANVMIPENSSLIDKTGVYIARILIKKMILFGMANIGFRPTLKENGFAVEVHIFNFSDDIYGETISIDFLSRIRNELTFNSVAALKEQIDEDFRQSQEFLSDLFHSDPYTQ